MRKFLLVPGVILGLYLFGRAIVEPFIIDFGDPTTYRHDWGGPSLAGVLAVHCGPGLLFGAAIVTALVRRYGRPPAGTRRLTGTGGH
ncbi:hypothetical protein GCM10023322_01750 [Rugosimonospora acidiphila]|uniref:Uncharacterized protein n=1 Tax=Rugosimonospora acidiphila TaxID=556531 RepID=A0ABP9RID7_9ACTN